jgi:hypothetical protein
LAEKAAKFKFHRADNEQIMRMKTLIFSLIVSSFPFLGLTQPVLFTADSIPMSGGKVVFSIDFPSDLSKEDIRKKAYQYLNSAMDPYSGTFLVNNDDQTICKITDFIPAEGGFLQSFGMYQRYRLELFFEKGICRMVIRDITFMEKQYFETQEKSSEKLRMPVYTAEDIMIKRSFSLLTIKNVSGKITDGSLKRINGVVSGLHAAFAKK